MRSEFLFAMKNYSSGLAVYLFRSNRGCVALVQFDGLGLLLSEMKHRRATKHFGYEADDELWLSEDSCPAERAA